MNDRRVGVIVEEYVVYVWHVVYFMQRYTYVKKCVLP